MFKRARINPENLMSQTTPATGSTVDLTVFIACYNEEANIQATFDCTIAALQAASLSWEIIVIDDASTDRSVSLIQDYIRRHPHYLMRLVQNRENRGLAYNYVEGAFLGCGEYYRLVCGDNSESEEALTGLFRQVGKAEMIVPYHVILGRSVFRHMLSRTFTALVNLVSGYRLRYYNGCAVHRTYNVLRWHSYLHGFGFQADLVTRLLDQGVSCTEIPMTSSERSAGRSKALTFKNFLSVAHMFLDLALRRTRKILYPSSLPRLPGLPVVSETALPPKHNSLDVHRAA
jgi:glycosyltransferase involved in cell wall biosynthesis